MDYFYKPQPLDLSVLGFDVLGLKEILSVDVGKEYSITKHLTIKDIPSSIVWETGELPYVMTDLKEQAMYVGVEELRQVLISAFQDEISKYKSPIQYVHTPVCYFDYAPGDTNIFFKIYTNRFLGEQK